MAASIFIALLVGVALHWLWLNISPTMRLNASQRLDPPQDEKSAPRNASKEAALPHIVILAPGRNEASFIRTTLPQLCEQDYPNYHVVYIDDHSDDETPVITTEMKSRYRHLIVLRNEIEPPPGWVGKCWAIKRGYEEWLKRETEARGDRGTISPDHLPPADLICLTDADVNWHPLALRTAANTMRKENADIVSLFPGMVFGSAIERVLMSTLTFALLVLFPVKRAMDPSHPDTLTAGAFILTKRKLYDQIGGHESVKNQVVEDVNLGRKLKAAGGKVWIAFTQQLIYCRMYEGWDDIWEGLTKNAYAGMEYKLHIAIALLAANLLALTFAPLYLLISLAWLITTGSGASLLASFLSAAILLLQARIMNNVRRNFKLPARYAWSLPLGAAIYFPIAIASIWRYYRGGNIWKGRSYGAETVK